MFFLLLLVTDVFDLHAQVQGHDMVILRNSKGRTVKSYFNGINLEGADKSGRGIYGVIRKIRTDSIFIQTYDVRKQYNMWGTSVLDTVTSYLTPYHVNEVAWIRKPPAKFEFVRDGSLFMIGGVSLSVTSRYQCCLFKTTRHWLYSRHRGGHCRHRLRYA